MGFSYTNDPKNKPLDAIRFLLGDTTEATSLLTDEELTYIMDMYSTSPVKQLSVAYRQCANKLAHKAPKRSLGPQSEDTTETFKYYEKQANKYEKTTSYGNLPSMPELVAAVFDKGMMSNVSVSETVE